MRYSRHFFCTAILAPAVIVVAAVSPLQASDLDSRVEYTIKNSYNFKAYLAQDDIAVHCSAGVVTLSGIVLEDYDRSLAAETAADIAGVKSVINEITVKGAQPNEQSDDWITMKVKGALAYHKHVSATGTDVETVAGVVTLKGQVASEAQKELTTEYALDVDGVKKVDNQQTVVGTPAHRTVGAKIDDASITAQVKAALLAHRGTHMLSTRVKTDRGVVTIRGEARNPAEKELVTRLVADLRGVRKVHNRMTVAQ